MGKYAWTTDCHLDHINQPARLINFFEGLVVNDPTAIVITGDISNASNLVYHLSAMERVVQRPIYFVLGNHDYYSSDIETVRKQMNELNNTSQHLKYLATTSYVPLSAATALVGHDGWYDALNGDALNSRFMMADWVYIRDLVQHSGGRAFINNGNIMDRSSLISTIRRLASEGVKHMADGIKAAVRYHKHIVVATHVPPFEESHVFKGKVGDSNAQPWFTSKLCGDMLLSAARAMPNVHFTVLCGHTHGKYDGKVLPNLEVHVGAAEYGSPVLASLVELP